MTERVKYLHNTEKGFKPHNVESNFSQLMLCMTTKCLCVTIDKFIKSLIYTDCVGKEKACAAQYFILEKQYCKHWK